MENELEVLEDFIVYFLRTQKVNFNQCIYCRNLTELLSLLILPATNF